MEVIEIPVLEEKPEEMVVMEYPLEGIETFEAVLPFTGRLHEKIKRFYDVRFSCCLD